MRHKPSRLAILTDQISADYAKVTPTENEYTLLLSSKQWYLVGFYIPALHVVNEVTLLSVVSVEYLQCTPHNRFLSIFGLLVPKIMRFFRTSVNSLNIQNHEKAFNLQKLMMQIQVYSRTNGAFSDFCVLIFC